MSSLLEEFKTVFPEFDHFHEHHRLRELYAKLNKREETLVKNMAETVEELRRKLDLYEKDPEKRAYFSLVRIVNMQVGNVLFSLSIWSL